MFFKNKYLLAFFLGLFLLLFINVYLINRENYKSQLEEIKYDLKTTYFDIQHTKVDFENIISQVFNTDTVKQNNELNEILQFREFVILLLVENNISYQSVLCEDKFVDSPHFFINLDLDDFKFTKCNITFNNTDSVFIFQIKGGYDNFLNLLLNLNITEKINVTNSFGKNSFYVNIFDDEAILVVLYEGKSMIFYYKKSLHHYITSIMD